MLLRCSIISMLLLTSTIQAKGPTLRKMRVLFSSGKISSQVILNKIKTELKLSKENQYRIDALKKDQRYIKQYQTIKTNNSMTESFKKIIDDLELVARSKYSPDQYIDNKIQALYLMPLLKIKPNDEDVYKVLNSLLTYLGNRLEFDYQSSSNIYQAIKDKKLKKSYKAIIKRFIQIEYNNNLEQDLPIGTEVFLN